MTLILQGSSLHCGLVSFIFSFPGCGPLPSHLRAGVQALVGPGSSQPPPPQVAARTTLSSGFCQVPCSLPRVPDAGGW